MPVSSPGMDLGSSHFQDHPITKVTRALIDVGTHKKILISNIRGEGILS